MNPFYKNLALWIVITLMMIMLYNLFNQQHLTETSISYTEFLAMVDSERVSDVVIQGQELYVTDSNHNRFKIYAPQDSDLIKILREKGVSINAKPESESPWYMSVLVSWFPMIVLIGVWIFFMRQMQAGGGKAMSFGKSRARLQTDQSKKVTFEDVAGIDEAKEELGEIVEFLREPKKFTRLGGRIPKGVLLMGSPGTGKTLLARAIAGEADVPFFHISGSDFVEMFVGVGASRVRDLFVQGKKNAPCIIFIDEIDAVGRHRGAGLGGGHDEREQTLNQLLVELDGFDANEGIIVLAATNRPDVLDPALLRPGRFDRQVIVSIPDVKGRLEIIKVHKKNIPLADDVDLEVLARGTPGFSGADIANLVNEAALLAARQSKIKVEMIDFENAKDKVMMGKERKSMIISPEEKKNTAYHEAGHALVARLTLGTDPIHKVSIIPRGMALGVTQQLPIDDKYTYSREHLLGTLAVLMGGRAAEEIALDHMTTGAGNDLERATELARKMVCEWGMSDKMGPITFGKKQEQIFLGREIAQHKDYSEKTAEEIDHEVKNIITERYRYAKNLLSEKKAILFKVAELLLDRETIDAADLDAVIEGKEVSKPEPVKTDKDTPTKTEDVNKEESKPGPAKPGSDMGAAPEAAV